MKTFPDKTLMASSYKPIIIYKQMSDSKVILEQRQ